MYKRALFIIAFLLFISFEIVPQNLFLNPDFEAYEECPDGYSGINKLQCTDWKCIAGSPDYFNCSFYGVHAGMIFGTPSSGNGLVGMWGLINNIYCDGQLQRESIAADLAETLIPCETYRVTFDIRLDTAGPASIPGFGHDCLDFGFYFYKGLDPNVCGNSCGCWNVQPQVSISSGLIPENEYITFSFEFIAQEEFDKVAIGPFCNDNMFLTECFNPQDNFGPFSLYFNLDNIILEHVEKQYQILNADTMLCMGDSLLLDATIIDATNYLWQDSSTLPTLKVFESGMYIVEVEIECATFKDTIIVQFNTHPEVSLGQDTTLCLGDTLLLGAFTPNGIYRWQDESDLEQFKVETSGEYWVEVKNECATSSDTINIIGIQSPVLNLEPTVSICENDIVTLNVSAPNSNYLWQDSTTSPIYDISIPGAYWVQVSNSCGEAADTMYVNWSECECNVYVPNVFTPNHDNINDRFMPWFSCEIKVYEILIFNRWGELVYSSKDLGEYWNGSYHGKDCQSGVYGYLLSYTTYSGESDHKYGDITLLR